MKTLAILFILYVICSILSAIFDPDSSSSTYAGSNEYTEECSDENEGLFDKVYSDGSWRVKGPLGINYYSDGKTSYTGFWGEEVRSNGETVSNGWVFDKDGNHVGYEYDDILGITHRCDRN